MGDNIEERLTALEVGQAEIKAQQEVLKNNQEKQEKRIEKNEEYREKAIETDYEIKSSIKELVIANTTLVNSNKDLSKTMKEVVTRVDNVCNTMEKTNIRVDEVHKYMEEKQNDSKKTISDIKSTFIKRVVEIIIVIVAVVLGLSKYL